MKNRPHRLSTSFAALLFTALALVASAPHADASRRAMQRAQREHLTPEEIEQIRDNQELDKRMGVFAKAAERRMRAIIQPQAAASKQEQKEAEKSGELPESTRAQLLSDIAKILDEAITNIDDAAIHNEKSPLVPKALRKLAEAAGRLVTQLTPLRDAGLQDNEREALERAIENAQSIVGALSKLPAETKK